MFFISKTQSKAPVKTGYTLAEILIVIVIIGVMASLALPRFMGQTEKAKTAEAINMLSVIRRSMLQYADANANTFTGAVITIYCNVDGTVLSSTEREKFQSVLGMQVPNCGEASWTYSTAADGSATATRIIKGNETPPVGTLSVDAAGTWTGDGDYAKDTGKYWPF